MNKPTQCTFHGLVLTMTLFFVKHAASAASFNCDKAQTQVEKLICADPTLSADDDQLVELFKIPKEYALQHDEEIYVGQRTWLKNVRNACTTAACLHTAYQNQIGYLKDEISRLFHKSVRCELPSPIAAKSGCEIIYACAENSDYSFLQAASRQCDNEKAHEKNAAGALTPINHVVDVYYYQNKDAKPVLLKPLAVEIWQERVFGISWLDSDRNGFATLSVGISCGASECDSEIFRYDPQKNEMYDFLPEVGDTGFSYFDGYLIEFGKGVSSYEVQARKVNQVGTRDVVQEGKVLVISTEMKDETHDETCSVYEETDNDNKARPAKLPNKKWLKYCATADYDK
jgi:uncharacterized protein